MLEDQEVSGRESLNGLGLTDQNSMANAKGDGLESLERKGDSRAGCIVRPEDSTGGRDITD